MSPQTKIFRGKDVTLLYSQLKLLFPTVTCAKPRSSRNASIEAFAVCQNYAPPPGFQPSKLQDVLDAMSRERAAADAETGAEHDVHSILVPFLACGDLTGCDHISSSMPYVGPYDSAHTHRSHPHRFDSDQTYALPVHNPDGTPYASLPPVQPPIAPAYQEALERARAAAHGGKAAAPS